jgi:hypothetical protein
MFACRVERRVCVSEFASVCVRVCARASACVVGACMHVYVRACVCVCVRVHVSMCGACTCVVVEWHMLLPRILGTRGSIRSGISESSSSHS